MPTSKTTEKAKADLDPATVAAMAAVEEGIQNQENKKAKKEAGASQEELRAQTIEDQLAAIEEKMFFDPPQEVKDIEGNIRKIKAVSWKKERRILKEFKKMLTNTPMPENAGMGSGNISGIGNIANYVVDLVSNSDTELTEIFSVITGLDHKDIDDDYHFEVIVGTVLPFVLSLFGSAMKTTLKSMRYKKGDRGK